MLDGISDAGFEGVCVESENGLSDTTVGSRFWADGNSESSDGTKDKDNEGSSVTSRDGVCVLVMDGASVNVAAGSNDKSSNDGTLESTADGLRVAPVVGTLDDARPGPPAPAVSSMGG